MKNLSKKNRRNLANHNKSKILRNKFIFETYYPWINSVQIGKRFTNKVKDPSEFASKIYYVLSTLIPTIYKNPKIFRNGNKYPFPHCHIINVLKYSKQISILQKICLILYGNDFRSITQKGSRSSWWQLGLTQSIRIFGIYDHLDNIFYPLVCDWYHLLIPDYKHNQKDYFREKSYAVQNLKGK